jgi:type I restriction enzyme M protein
LRHGRIFLAAYEYIVNHHKLDLDQRRHLRSGAFTGWEIVDNTARLWCSGSVFHVLQFIG